MPDLPDTTDADIHTAVFAALTHADEHGPGWSALTADTISAQLRPVIRALLGRPRPGYTYRSVVVDWTDGDTVHLDIDLGLRQWAHDEPIRLLGVNAPDRKPLKAQATAWMRNAAPTGSELIVRTHLDEEDKYGRLLGDLYLPASGLHLNTALIDAGLGQHYAGGARPADY